VASEEPTQANRVRSRWGAAAALAYLLLVAPHPVLPTACGKAEVFEKDHYYKAKGIGLQVRWDVPQTTVEEGHDLVATLVIGSQKYPVLNPTEVVRPDLKKLPAFADRFTITDVPESPRKVTDKEVRFSYKLRPRNRGVDQIPALEFEYFNPAAGPGTRQFRHTQAESVSINVSDPPKPALPVPVPMVEADRLFQVNAGPAVLNPPFLPAQWMWFLAALFGPVAGVAWYLAWQRIYPDAARMAHLRRSRAARRALDAVRKSNRAPDPPAIIAAAVLSYLRTRFPLPESAVTPSEIAAALLEAKVPSEMAEEIAEVFRGCDRARFAPPGDSGASLATDAETAITRLEALA
jgi:hypothetical protein